MLSINSRSRLLCLLQLTEQVHFIWWVQVGVRTVLGNTAEADGKSAAIRLCYKARTLFIPPGFERCFRSILASSQRTLEQLLVRSISESNQNGQVAGFSLFGCVPGNENEAICFCLCVRDDPVSSLARLAFSIATSKSKENKNYFWFLHSRPSVTIHLNFTIQFSEAFTWAGFLHTSSSSSVNHENVLDWWLPLRRRVKKHGASSKCSIEGHLKSAPQTAV